MAYVYKHIRKDTNQPFYIGIAKNDLDNFRRAKCKKYRSLHWKNIVAKTDYEIEIVLENISWIDAKQKEIELIKECGRADFNNGPLVNKTDGGDSPTWTGKHTTETKKKLSDHFKNINGKNHPKHGISLSDDHKEKLRNKSKNLIWINNSTINKRIQTEHVDEFLNEGWVKGRLKYFTPELREKFSKMLSGENNPFYGKTHSNETKKKIIETRKKNENINRNCVI